MANTLGNFTKLDNVVFTGTFRTLNFTGTLTVAPVKKMSDDAPDHRVFAGPTLLHGLIVWRRGVDGIGRRARS